MDWNSEASQELRFEQLLRVAEGVEPLDLIDYGSGYGALASYLDRTGREFTYTGFDLSEDMLAHARAAAEGDPRCRFVASDSELSETDYTVASGIFNVRLDTPEDQWFAYVLRTLDRLDELSRCGFAFNVLTSYSDRERMRNDLFYADPCVLFDRCKRHYSRDVALLHDYGLYEFTILVRKTA